MASVLSCADSFPCHYSPDGIVEQLLKQLYCVTYYKQSRDDKKYTGGQAQVTCRYYTILCKVLEHSWIWLSMVGGRDWNQFSVDTEMYFHINTNMIFALFTVLTFTLMVQKQWWIKTAGFLARIKALPSICPSDPCVPHHHTFMFYLTPLMKE